MKKLVFLSILLSISYIGFGQKPTTNFQTEEEASALDILKPKIGFKGNLLNFTIAESPGKINNGFTSPSVGIIFQYLFGNRLQLELNKLSYIEDKSIKSNQFNFSTTAYYDAFLFKHKSIKKRSKFFVEPYLNLNISNSKSRYLLYDIDTAYSKSGKKYLVGVNTVESDIISTKIALRLGIGICYQYKLNEKWSLEAVLNTKFAELSYLHNTYSYDNSTYTNSPLTGGFDGTDSQIKIGFSYLLK